MVKVQKELDYFPELLANNPDIRLADDKFYTTECSKCGKTITFGENAFRSSEDKDTYCKKCFGIIHPTYIKSRATRCTDCGEVIILGNGNCTSGGEGYLCIPCWGKRYPEKAKPCAVCGGPIAPRRMPYNRVGRIYYHVECWKAKKESLNK